mgnify:CR=1 FL=1
MPCCRVVIITHPPPPTHHQQRTGLPGLNGSTYSPVLLLGGRVNASTAASSAAPGSSGLGPLRRDLWLLETACADPDANAPNALPSANRPPQTTQVGPLGRCGPGRRHCLVHNKPRGALWASLLSKGFRGIS